MGPNILTLLNGSATIRRACITIFQPSDNPIPVIESHKEELPHHVQCHNQRKRRAAVTV